MSDKFFANPWEGYPVKVRFVPCEPVMSPIEGDDRCWRLYEDFWFYTETLGWCRIPQGFICDLESVPLFRGSNPVAGIIHDWLCRKDPQITNRDNGLTKEEAADVYQAFQHYYSGIQQARLEMLGKSFIGLFTVRAALLRAIKTATVRIWPCYWQRFGVADPYEVIRFGVQSDR